MECPSLVVANIWAASQALLRGFFITSYLVSESSTYVYIYIYLCVCIKSSMLYDHPSPGGFDRYDSDLCATRTVAIPRTGFRPARSVGGGGLRFRLSIRRVGWLHDGAAIARGTQDPHIWGSYFRYGVRSHNFSCDFVNYSRGSYFRYGVRSHNFP